jgi:hypothetical protein
VAAFQRYNVVASDRKGLWGEYEMEAPNPRRAAIGAWENMLHLHKNRIKSNDGYAVVVEHTRAGGTTILDLYLVTKRIEMEHLGRLQLNESVRYIDTLLHSLIINGLHSET